MLSGLDLSPMVILLLLLYGLLIAFSLVLWSALNLRQRSRATQAGEQQSAAGAAAGRKSVTAVRPDPAVRVRPDQGTPASGRQKPWLRAEQPPAAGSPGGPGDSRVHVHPGRPPAIRLATRDQVPEVPAPEADAGLQDEPKTVFLARRSAPAAPPVAEEAPARPAETPVERVRNEDAFERFLRSSRNDPDLD